MKADRFQHKKKSIAGRAAEEGYIAHTRERGHEKGEVFDFSKSARAFLEKTHVETDSALLESLLKLAGESPTARGLASCARAKSWSCHMDDLGGAGFTLDHSEKILRLDHFGLKASAIARSSHYSNTIALNLIKGLRRIWHAERGVDDGSSLRPESALMLARALAADCETVAILAAWEWRGAGHAEPWRVLLGSEEGDMAMAFTRALEKDPAGFYDGSILARAFCQWYADEARIGACDSAALAKLDVWLKENKKLGQAALAPGNVESAAALPGGANYLSGMGGTICADPYFLDMHDPINEAHLFQIIHDSKAHIAGGVPFRDSALAARIFPDMRVKLPE